MAEVPPHHVTGGAGPEEAAAIAAAIDFLMAEAAARSAQAPESPAPSDWVLAGRPRPFHAPLASHVYDAMGGWGIIGDEEDHLRD